MITYPERVNLAIERYSSLVKYVERLAFPKHKHELPAEANKWGKVRRALYKLSQPLTIGQNSFGETLGFFVLIFFAQVNLGWGVMFLASPLYGYPSLLSFSDIGSTISAIIAFVCAAFLIPVTYFWWYNLFTDRKYKCRTRIVLMLVEIVLLLVLSLSLIAQGTIKQGINLESILSYLVAYALFLIPVLSYLLLLSCDTLTLVGQLISSTNSFLKSLHNPLPYDQVRKIAIEDISASDGQTWKLADMTLHDVRTLRQWAEANRESTDKRTLPTIIVIAFLTLLFTSDTMRAWLDPFVQQWFQRIFMFWTIRTGFFTKDYFVSALIIVISILVIGFIVKTFSRLFVNLAVQSLVIEACILAENSHDENYPVMSLKASSNSLNGMIGFIKSIFDLFRK